MESATITADASAAMFRRTLRFAVSVAAELACPDRGALKGGHTVGKGYYYEFSDGKDLSEKDLKLITDMLDKLVTTKASIVKVDKPWKEMYAYFEQRGLKSALALMTTRATPEVRCYESRGVLRMALFPLFDNFSALAEGSNQRWAQATTEFARIVRQPPGMIAVYDKDTFELQAALHESNKDHGRFGDALGVRCVGELNSLQQVGRARQDFILQCELRQEQKLASIASDVAGRWSSGKPVKLICIAGPTSSGKTTFATKLCMYLTNLGYVAKPLVVDHYYLPLNEQPKYKIRQQRSDVDYDDIESMDVALVGQQLKDIMAGRTVKTPVYNMKTGYRDGEGTEFAPLPSNGILVIEGIHALNPLYTQAIDPDRVYKIFISALTSLQIDDANAVKTTNHRLLRRMCRDYLFRGNSASTTLKMWDSVRKGEGVWIFPHQNSVHFVMNSAAEYELPMLKTFTEPLLRGVLPTDPNFNKAQELLQLLDHFSTWPPGLAPTTALIREFIGDGAYDCH